MSDKNLMELKEADIEKQTGIFFEDFLSEDGFSHKPVKMKAKKEETTFSNSVSKYSSHGDGESTVHLLKSIEKVSDAPIQTDTQNHIANVILRAGGVASEMCSTFGNVTNLNNLRDRLKYDDLSGPDQSEFNGLLNTSALVTMFTFASYINFVLSDYMTDQNVNITIPTPEEIIIDEPFPAMKGVLFELNTRIQEHASNDVELVAVVKAYVAGLISELQLRRSSVSYIDAFEANSYRVEKDKFEISGLDTQKRTASSKIEMVRVEPENVVGNKDAKNEAIKLAKIMAMYDFQRQRNPILELAGFPLGVMGDGMPGTGKTTLFQMFCTLLGDYAKAIGRPFNIEQFTPDMISSYQGKSAQTAKEVLVRSIDPHGFGVCLFDDVDQTTAHRSDDKASAGQQEVTAVLMEVLAGASTVVRGNSSVFMFSNYPEKVDDALRQRAGKRWNIDGPKTQDDFIDLAKVFLRDKSELVDGDHAFFEAQRIAAASGEDDVDVYAQYNIPSDEKLMKIYEEIVGKNGSLNSIKHVGEYLFAIQQEEPRFTGRAVKNIFDSVKMRTADFDAPEEWFENLDLFINQPYERKVEMLREFIKPITAEVILQEINRYADSEFRYADKSFEEEVNKSVRYYNVQQAAQEIFNGK